MRESTLVDIHQLCDRVHACSLSLSYNLMMEAPVFVFLFLYAWTAYQHSRIRTCSIRILILNWPLFWLHRINVIVEVCLACEQCLHTCRAQN